MKNFRIAIAGLAAASTMFLSPVVACPRSLEIPKIQQNMPYSKAREMLLSVGWQATYNREQLMNPNKYAPVSSFIEKGYTEIIACSGTGLGLCSFEFRSAYGELLVVVTADNHEGDPKVFSWRITTPDRASDKPVTSFLTKMIPVFISVPCLNPRAEADV